MITEGIITAIIAAVVTGITLASAAIGSKRRDKIDAVKAATDLDLKLAEREDRLRSKLWEDVEEKIAAQDVIIGELKETVKKQAAQLEKQASQIKELVKENKELRHENHNLRNGKNKPSMF